jgi:hypothetical protein
VLAQPEPDEGVVVEENYNGSQPNSFEACGEEHSEIEAGTQPVFQYLTARSNFLAVTLRRGDLFQKRAALMQEWADYCAKAPADTNPPRH